MPVRYLLEDIHAEPFPEFHHPLLMAGGAEMTPLARGCQEVFVAAVFAFHTGKPVVDVAAIQIPINHLLDLRSPESALSCIQGFDFLQDPAPFIVEPGQSGLGRGDGLFNDGKIRFAHRNTLFALRHQLFLTDGFKESDFLRLLI